jgi:hypothetical protein
VKSAYVSWHLVFRRGCDPVHVPRSLHCSEFVSMGLTVNAISELILLLLMTVAVILAYRKLTQLDVNSHPISLLDDLLLFFCIPAFFLYGIFSIVPAMLKNNGLSIAITLLQVTQTADVRMVPSEFSVCYSLFL